MNLALYAQALGICFLAIFGTIVVLSIGKRLGDPKTPDEPVDGAREQPRPSALDPLRSGSLRQPEVVEHGERR